MDANASSYPMRCFQELQDPRVDRTRDHELQDIIVLAIMAVVCGADGWVAVEDFGRAKYDWLKTILALPHGIPSHDTFGRVFAKLDPHAFEKCFLNWIKSLIDISGQGALHIDGKTLRRSFDRASSKAAIHMVSAWAGKSEMALSQVATDAKSNEITAIPKLLDLIVFNGAVITIDATPGGGVPARYRSKDYHRGRRLYSGRQGQSAFVARGGEAFDG